MKSIQYRSFFVLIPLVLAAFSVHAQSPRKDKAVYKEYPTSYYRSTILKGINEYEEGQQETKPRRSFKVDLSNMDVPRDPAEYEKVWHTNPISQGRTGTCWCFSTTSFYESEVKRLSGKEVALSEMYTVYWEYVERARYFVQSRGKMYFGEGSETNAVARMMKKYGVVPREAYTGKKAGQKWHSHSAMYKELDAYLKGVKTRNAWNEAEVVATTRAILDHHLGAPPKSVKVGSKMVTPLEYMEKELNLRADDYVNFMSLMSSPYYEKAEYDVPDNWWNSEEYYNVPLQDFMTGMKEALKQGYSFAIGGDVSEAGLVSHEGVAVVPTFDIPSEYIDENARQLRFNNGSTTDDHAMHVVGYKEKDGETWYLVKDSGSGSRNCGEDCKSFGYYFFHADYIKLKMMNFTVHKNAVKDLLRKINKS